MTEQPAPYGDTTPEPDLPRGRVRVPHLHQMKREGRRWAMLTAYDRYTAATFDEAGIPVVLVGDSAANNVYAYDTTLPVTVEELLPLARAVSSSTTRALVIADLPFGSYEASPEQALTTATRFLKEAGVQAVKIEGGPEIAPHVQLLSQAGIPVMAHIGFTPQREHTLGGYRVQGRDAAGDELIQTALTMQDAGAFAILLEMIPGELATRLTQRVTIPTVGIGAGAGCDAQVLVWQDMAGLRTGRLPRFVKQYANLHDTLLTAARDYATDVERGTFPAPEHTF